MTKWKEIEKHFGVLFKYWHVCACAHMGTRALCYS